MPTVSFGQLTADFSASPTSGCSPFCVNFKDLSTGGPTSWTWSFGDGSNSFNTPTPSHCYYTPGVYSVTLTISNGSGSNTITKTNYILVYNKPVANFTLSADTACLGQVVTFTDASTISSGGAPIKQYDWDFGDGNSKSVTSPSVTHVYTTAGVYPVSLIITDTSGCTGVVNKSASIVVIDPKASFSAAPLSACTAPLSVTFTNASTSGGGTSYAWNFGDGSGSSSANPVHTYTASGTYTVTLVVKEHGCSDTLVKKDYVAIRTIAPAFAATPTAVCTGQSVTFANGSVPAAVSSSWNFGDGGSSASLNPVHTFTTAGTFSVSLKATDANGCSDSIVQPFTVYQTPKADFTADTMVSCSVPFSVSFANTSTGGTNYLWTFGDGATSALTNPTHTYTAAGTYTVSLLAINAPGGCADSITRKAFIVVDPPVAAFIQSPDSGCVPLTVNFTDKSTSAVEPVTTHSWTFGDGNVSSSQNPAHTYTATGIYTVTEIVKTANGCADTFVCKSCIKVGVKPVAKFSYTPDTICYGLPVTFSDSSVNATGWLWQFGDGGFSTIKNPTYVFADTGTFHPYLIAYNNGCSDTALSQTEVILPPKAQFTYSLSCTNYYTVKFTSGSEGADSLFWSFGDGTADSSNNASPVHTYGTRGPFTVTLTAYNFSSGCSNPITASFTIAQPKAAFTAPNGCYPFAANFTSTSQDAVSYFWNFGDPSSATDTSTAVNPSYTYAIPGTYSVTLTVTDVNGCTDAAVLPVKSLGPYPYFFADTLRGCAPLPVTFTDTSVTDSALVQWTWNFGDGSPLLTAGTGTVTHTYTATGVFPITMTVRDTNGCVKTITRSSYIQPTFPIPAFAVKHFSCKGTPLTFDASATKVIGGTYIWKFGDGSGDTTRAVSVTHAYGADSLYTVSLTVTDTNGCAATLTDTVRILKPVANFSDSILSVGCRTLQVQFIDHSSGFANQWSWSFGNGGNSTIQSPNYTYTQPGYWPVTLIVTNAGGCKDTVRLDSLFVPGPIGTFSFTPASGCDPLAVCFRANSANSDQFIWDFGDGTVVTTLSDTVCHTYTNPGTFNPTMIMQNTLPNGNPCLDQAPNLTGAVTVTNVINVSLGGPPSVHVPEDSIIAVNPSYSGGVAPYTVLWTPGTGIDCDTCASVLAMGTGDTVLYTFTVRDAAGCMGKTTLLVLSEPCSAPKVFPNVFSPNGDGVNDMFLIPGVCPSETYSLQIFDRWGVLLFITNQRHNGWDGRTTAGVEASDGVYYFIVTIGNQKDKKGMPVDDLVYKGFLQLVR